MNLEECIRVILDCKERTVYITPESEKLLPQVQTTFDLLGIAIYVNGLFESRSLVVLWENFTPVNLID